MASIEATKKGITILPEAELIEFGKEVVKEKYGNLFDMYKQITGEDPYEMPMRIYPAVHYHHGWTLGRL
jgi:succinate dehydrogenase / fumarate reductase flavoprotein subunit